MAGIFHAHLPKSAQQKTLHAGSKHLMGWALFFTIAKTLAVPSAHGQKKWRSAKNRTDILALLVARNARVKWNVINISHFFFCWAFFVFCCSTSYVDLYWKWALFFCCWCPAKEKTLDVVSFAGRFSEGGRKIFWLSSGLWLVFADVIALNWVVLAVVVVAITASSNICEEFLKNNKRWGSVQS